MPYVRFAVMVILATILVFCISYLNVAEADHLWFSLGRVWMALAMGAAIALSAILIQPGTLRSGGANSVIVVAALAVFAASAWLIRRQAETRDMGFMRIMIPHHSAALLASERAHLRDPRVRALADGILAKQQREIAQMEQLIADLRKNRPATDAPELPPNTPSEHTAGR